jgi:hypothetical protein
LAFIALRLWIRAEVEPADRDTLEFGFAFGYWMTLIALAAQLVVAVVTVVRVRELRLIAALAAAFTTAVIASLCIELLPSIASCVDPISIRSTPCGLDLDTHTLWFNLRRIASEGMVVALAGGLAALGVQAVLHRRHAPVPVTPPASG